MPSCQKNAGLNVQRNLMYRLLKLNILQQAPVSADMTRKNKIDRYINKIKKRRSCVN